jgi:prophage antirepressor-like protein
MLPLSTHLHQFEGQPLVTLTWDGRPCWVARHIGARLGYSHEGKRLPNKILGEWADEFVAGHDYALLQGEDLASFRAAVAASGLSTSNLGRGSLLVLFESGLHLVLAKTNLPIGKRLRRFLVDEVLPQLVRTGRYAPEHEGRRVPQEEVDRILLLFPHFKPRTPSLTARREARLALQARTRARWVDVCDRRLKVGALHRLVDALGDRLDNDARAAIEIVAAEIATGLDLAAAILPDPDGFVALVPHPQAA